MKANINLILSCFLLLTITTVIGSCSGDDNTSPNPTAAFTASKTSAIVNEEITFTNTSKDASSYVWSFGDGTTSTAESPVKTFATAGEYEVTLAAKNSSGSSSTKATITITSGTEVYFIDIDDAKIAKFAVNAPATVTNILDITNNNGLALAHDAVNQKIYFSGLDADDIGGVWTVALDGTGLNRIVTDLYDPYGIALNVAAGKLYIADSGEDLGAIYQTNLRGEGKITVVEKTGESAYVAVALDLVNNKMYYFPYDEENLYRANLDGTSKEIVVAGAFGYAVFVDPSNNKIYYNNRNSASGDLMSASLTGTNPVTVDATASRIYGITISNNKLYWSSRENGEIYQANLDGSGKITLKSGLTSPRGIFVK